MTDPSPTKMYYRHFGKFPLYIFEERVGRKDFVDFYVKYFDDGAVNNIVLTANNICYVPKSKSWAMFCSKEFELAIFCTNSIQIKHELILSIGLDTDLDYSMAYEVSFLKKMGIFSETGLTELDLILQNYQDP